MNPIPDFPTDPARTTTLLGDLDAALARVEASVHGMTTALRDGDSTAVAQQALVLRSTIATDLDVWERALGGHAVPAPTRQRIALVSAMLRVQRDAVTRGHAAATRALEIIVPPQPLPYDEDGQTSRLQTRPMPI